MYYVYIFFSISKEAHNKDKSWMVYKSHIIALYLSVSEVMALCLLLEPLGYIRKCLLLYSSQTIKFMDPLNKSRLSLMELLEQPGTHLMHNLLDCNFLFISATTSGSPLQVDTLLAIAFSMTEAWRSVCQKDLRDGLHYPSS